MSLRIGSLYIFFCTVFACNFDKTSFLHQKMWWHMQNLYYQVKNQVRTFIHQSFWLHSVLCTLSLVEVCAMKNVSHEQAHVSFKGSSINESIHFIWDHWESRMPGSVPPALWQSVPCLGQYRPYFRAILFLSSDQIQAFSKVKLTLHKYPGKSCEKKGILNRVSHVLYSL